MATRSEDIDALRQLAANWRSAWLAGDVDALMSLYGDEPVLMPQDQPAVLGRADIRALYQAVLAEYDFRSDSTVVEVDASGDLGYLWSSYVLTATPRAGGKPITSVGKSVFVLRRESGAAWKIVRLIDNSDGAPPSRAADAAPSKPR